MLGSSVSRIDGPLKVTGAATYGADFAPDGLVYGYVLTSTVGNATIRAMDVSAAESAPGVLAVYTPFAPLKLLAAAGPLGRMWLPLRDMEVGHHGQIIGLVVASTFEQARDAAMTVHVDYDVRPAVTSLVDAMPDAVIPPVTDGEPSVLTFLAEGVSSIEDALAASSHCVSATYSTPVQGHAAMEPHSTVARWDHGTMIVHTGTQGVDVVAADLAVTLGLDPSQVRVITPFVGGAFGGKVFTSAQTYLTAAAARELDRPVKVVLSREQTFSSTWVRSGTVQKVSLGADSDGTLNALAHDTWAARSALVELPGGEPSAHRTSRSWYASRNIAISHRLATLNMPPNAIMRGPGEATGSFALEVAMDELAVMLDMDPIELRMKNYATVYPGRNVPWSSKHLDECYSVGAERFGWHRRNPSPGATLDGDWYVGMGMATAVHPNFRSTTSAKITLRPDNMAEVSCSTGDLGTGMWTVLAMIGADSLELPLDRIEPHLGDSALPSAPLLGGSRGTANVTSAVHAAAIEIKRKLIDLAATHPLSPLRESPNIRYANGCLECGSQSLDFGALLRMVGSDGLDVVTSTGPGSEAQDYAFCTFGAQFCEVRVNRWTGEPRVSRLLSVIDAGQIINTKTARSQIVGGMIWGVSAALHEGLHLEPTGRLANGNLAEYLVPINADIKEAEVHFLTYPDHTHNPVGARGIGEVGIVGVAAAITNAIYNATSKRIRTLPITIESLL
ncbi:xanthine dehydrogenase family protein molybdopterin-binding subunit [Actinocrispum sp. NPDC049592]|uniref:xanthine dehydrogenase family protein molybdopterin-binding subunit n=1 Tax=Actinocrispum sp. NPDC049592 TaxID=3154835 RepID=UPI0034187B32